MGWAEYCAALVTAARMGDDMDGRTLVVHNGDVSYAECVLTTAHCVVLWRECLLVQHRSLI